MSRSKKIGAKLSKPTVDGVIPRAGEPSPAAGRSIAAYVISTNDLNPSWMLLYGGTLVLQLFCALLRGIFAYAFLWLAFTIAGQSTVHVNALASVVAYGPLVLSFATLVLPLGGWWWRQQSGGRSPSERERFAFEDAITTLTQHDPGLRPPRRWFITDALQLNAAVYADTLMITRGLLESGYLEAVLAHELGHLNSSDGRLAAALHRMTTPPRWEIQSELRIIALLVNGGLAVWLTRAPWGVYWRAREYHADLYAANLGQAQSLAMFLETNALENDIPVPFVWLTDTTHPPTEHRVDRLLQHGL
jgi:Zn-dependent protease with chaperone function